MQIVAILGIDAYVTATTLRYLHSVLLVKVAMCLLHYQDRGTAVVQAFDIALETHRIHKSNDVHPSLRNWTAVAEVAGFECKLHLNNRDFSTHRACPRLGQGYSYSHD